jgi:Sulfotransferase domain
MGHLLGASPPTANTQSVSEALPQGHSTWVEVTSVRRSTPDAAAITAFAVDSPPAGVCLRGTGLEVTGWAIGRDAPIAGVRVLADHLPGPTRPLDVLRPDVAADYPDIPHARSSGFSFWASIASAGDGCLTLEALLANGQSVPLAELKIASKQRPKRAIPGTRSVEAPDFVIVGAQRGGTTSLFAYLSAHPQVAPAAMKESHFLTDRYDRGLEWYLGLLPAALPPTIMTGEATPYALFHPLAAQRLGLVAPQAKVIVLLRNPVERAYSHFAMERARGDEALDFAAALDAEPERLAGEEERLIADPTYVSRAHKHFSYVARGEYPRQLERWRKAVSPDRLMILRSEDLYTQPEATFARVASFLGIDSRVRVPFTVHNRGDAPPLDSRLRQRLAEHFAPHNVQLRSFLGWDPAWR